MKMLIVFDLDGTLAESKSDVDPEMVQALSNLQDNYNEIAVISGCSWGQMKKQFATKFSSFHNVSMLHLLPVSGAQYFITTGNEAGWVKVSEYKLNPRDKVKIFNAFDTAINKYTDIFVKDTIISPAQSGKFGDIAEDRVGQITFSMLGQNAPLDQKIKWDPDRKKRKFLVEKMKRYLPEFEVRIGGTTSIDVNKCGINKAFGIKKLCSKLSITDDNVTFTKGKLT